MGEALRGGAGGSRRRRRTPARSVVLVLSCVAASRLTLRAEPNLPEHEVHAAASQRTPNARQGDEREARGVLAGDQPATRIDIARFTAIAYGADTVLARHLLQQAAAHDTFPGLPRPTEHILIAIAPDRAHFRAWAGPAAPEWGAGLAFPDAHKIVLQGHSAPSTAGNPTVTLRHELAHMALHEFFAASLDVIPRWFDEGYACYAAGEVGRDDALAANIALAIRGTPSLAQVDSGLTGTALQADASYALAYRAVADLAARDPHNGLTLLLADWRDSGSLDRAIRRAYGVTMEAYESDWRARVRRRYGALALVTDLSAASLLLLLLVAPLYVIRRRRDRERLAALRAAEEAADARERRDAVDALLAALPPGPGGIK